MKDGANPIGKKRDRMEYLQHILIRAQSYRLQHGHLIDDMIRYFHFEFFVIHFGLFLANTCYFFAISLVPTMTLPDSIVLDRTNIQL